MKVEFDFKYLFTSTKTYTRNLTVSEFTHEVSLRYFSVFGESDGNVEKVF